MTPHNTGLGWLLVAWACVLGLIVFGVGVLLSTLFYGDWEWFDRPLTTAITTVLIMESGWTSDRTLAWLLRGWPRR